MSDTPPPGLRERKRRQTRERLIAGAMRLFLERGFDSTTIEAIAAAADVARRTFFHYFASKEDLVFAWQDASDEAINAALAAQPAGAAPLRATEEALVAAISQFDHEQTLALARLIHETPTLHAREQAKYARLEQALAATLAARMGRQPGDLEPQLVAMAAIGALRVGTAAWLAEGGREHPVAYARRAFAALRAALG
ncbi:MAG TPA: TetR family transcriptional regulator [Herpetosiphonaceae bacterium]